MKILVRDRRETFGFKNSPENWIETDEEHITDVPFIHEWITSSPTKFPIIEVRQPSTKKALGMIIAFTENRCIKYVIGYWKPA
jgi:hypothetical protein